VNFFYGANRDGLYYQLSKIGYSMDSEDCAVKWQPAETTDEVGLNNTYDSQGNLFVPYYTVDSVDELGITPYADPCVSPSYNKETDCVTSTSINFTTDVVGLDLAFKDDINLKTMPFVPIVDVPTDCLNPAGYAKPCYDGWVYDFFPSIPSRQQLNDACNNLGKTI
jgi:hypothetical protein